MRVFTAVLAGIVCVEALAICILIGSIKSKVNSINVEVDRIVDATAQLEDRADIEALIKEIDELEASNKILYEKVVKRQKELDEESRRLDLIEKKNKK